nr:hypothetical protein [Tanacetum cinerariifolium]
MGGAMAQIRSEGGPIQSIDPPLSTGHTVQIREDMMEYKIELTDPIPQTPHDSPLLGGHTPGSDEGSMTQKELTDLCTTLLQKVIDLENVKTAQAKEIASLKKRVTKLEQRQSSRISGFHPLGRRKVSKKERKNLKSQQKFQDIDDLLDKGIAFKDADDSARPIRSITTLQPLPTIDLKDKGKGILQEPEHVKKTKKNDQDQIKRDAEVTLKIQEDLDEEAMTEREIQ